MAGHAKDGTSRGGARPRSASPRGPRRGSSLITGPEPIPTKSELASLTPDDLTREILLLYVRGASISRIARLTGLRHGEVNATIHANHPAMAQLRSDLSIGRSEFFKPMLPAAAEVLSVLLDPDQPGPDWPARFNAAKLVIEGVHGRPVADPGTPDKAPLLQVTFIHEGSAHPEPTTIDHIPSSTDQD